MTRQRALVFRGVWELCVTEGNAWRSTYEIASAVRVRARTVHRQMFWLLARGLVECWKENPRPGLLKWRVVPGALWGRLKELWETKLSRRAPAYETL